jgi:hypothetical protein
MEPNPQNSVGANRPKAAGPPKVVKATAGAGGRRPRVVVVGNPKRAVPILTLVTAIPVAMLIYRCVVVAQEYPSRTDQVLTMIFDVCPAIAAILIYRHMAKIPGNRTASVLVFPIVCVAAVVGLFAIRLTSRAALWTGHLRYIFGES